ncbi:tRNA lysidine(34) synthetase TilS [Rheinheimera sediminis]|uniref:tRNA lysidine(34) synthetase TilS n=1 Tax=Rheinheimera sp. YQF-1 TaxID=2499626 RepID=UPI000FD6E312|nr:tRNA lysidine(34) synthetase TilS [Rheinheimera sp. YQF-1]RVT46447.1 tRNA lysidine(34) synthetase TilS [Rheinheimera sp. YQF-1]
MSTELTVSLRQHIQQLGLNQLVLGLSGGLDSMVLLELCHQLMLDTDIKLKAVYIHHGLSANADQWADFCLQQCGQRHIPFEVQKVQLNPTANIEAQARAARYSALSTFVNSAQTALLTAHHADDQLETLLLALKRGAGPAGLSGIAVVQSFASGWLVRPLLDFSRGQLEVFAQEQQLVWIEDESNNDSRFDRNFLRLEVIPLLQQRWPAFRHNALRSVEHIQQQQYFVEKQLEQLLPTVMLGAELNLKLLAMQDFTTQKLLVRHWLALTGLNPSTDWLERFFSELMGAKADAQPLLELDTYQIRRFSNKAYITQVIEIPQAGVLSELKPGQQLNTVVGQFILSREGKGTALLLTDDPLYLVFGLFSLPFKPAGERQRKPLKQWLKLWAVPPWQRLQLPVLVQNGQVVAVLGLASNANAEQANAYIDWQKS